MRRSKVAKRYRTAADRKAAMDEFLIAYEKSLGVLKPACEMTGIPRQTVWDWRRRFPEFDKACKDCEEVAVDFVESRLYKQIQDGSEACTIFYLKTKGKRRGYIEKQELDVNADVKGVTINVSTPATAKILEDIIKKQ